MHKDIDLTNPKLGGDLLKDARGDLPVDVWMAYFWRHSDEWKHSNCPSRAFYGQVDTPGQLRMRSLSRDAIRT